MFFSHFNHIACMVEDRYFISYMNYELGSFLLRLVFTEAYEHKKSRGGEAFSLELDDRPIKKPLLPPIKMNTGPVSVNYLIEKCSSSWSTVIFQPSTFTLCGILFIVTGFTGNRVRKMTETHLFTLTWLLKCEMFYPG